MFKKITAFEVFLGTTMFFCGAILIWFVYFLAVNQLVGR